MIETVHCIKNVKLKQLFIFFFLCFLVFRFFVAVCFLPLTTKPPTISVFHEILEQKILIFQVRRKYKFVFSAHTSSARKLEYQELLWDCEVQQCSINQSFKKPTEGSIKQCHAVGAGLSDQTYFNIRGVEHIRMDCFAVVLLCQMRASHEQALIQECSSYDCQ